jgi:hypothetical protein
MCPDLMPKNGQQAAIGTVAEIDRLPGYRLFEPSFLPTEEVLI